MAPNHYLNSGLWCCAIMKFKMCGFVILMLFIDVTAFAQVEGDYDMSFCGALNFQNSPTYSNRCDSVDDYDSALEEIRARGWQSVLNRVWKKAKSQDRRASLRIGRQQKTQSTNGTIISKFFHNPRFGLRAGSHKLIMSFKMKF